MPDNVSNTRCAAQGDDVTTGCRVMHMRSGKTLVACGHRMQRGERERERLTEASLSIHRSHGEEAEDKD